MKLKHVATLTLAGLALAGCQNRTAASAPSSKVPEAKVVGEAVSCLHRNDYRETRVRDDRTIDFIGSGGRAWRNTLPYTCSGLGFNEAFGYSTSISQLCSTDIIWVIEQGSEARRGASCGLGKFVPVELPK